MRLSEYKVGQNKEFIESLRNNAWNCEYGYIKLNIKMASKRFKLELHTGGWSENEEIIEELQKNLFWLFCWQKSERGGHYYFEGDYS